MKQPYHRLMLLPLLVCTILCQAQVPLLNSNPGSDAVVFLDFDGQTVDETSWNYNGPIRCAESGLSAAQIEEVFNRVAEDYRPFDLNITTDSLKYFAAPSYQRTRVIITPTYQWWGASGGVAWTGSFTWGDDTPCFVFSGLLGNNPKNISESASHEAGHTLGLSHQSTYDVDCNKTAEYNPGNGNGEIGWAPIMGVGYYQNMTLWNIGPNQWGCDSYQNDLDILVSDDNGVGYRDDDHANNFSSSTFIPVTSSQVAVNGIIEKSNDQDIFRFIMPGAGRFQLEGAPFHVGANNSGSNLDMKVTLYDASQQEITQFGSENNLNTVADTMLNAGTYYFIIQGKGNLYAPAYASLGSYNLQASISETTSPLDIHQLKLKTLKNGDAHLLSWIINADEKLASQTIEISTDGKNFKTVEQVSKDSRSYSYLTTGSQTLYYRIQAIFVTGLRGYSNISSIDETSKNNDHPRLLSNLVGRNNISVSTPARCDYTVVDLRGKKIQSGKITTGISQIDLPYLSSGVYLFVFNQNGKQWTEKLIKH